MLPDCASAVTFWVGLAICIFGALTNAATWLLGVVLGIDPFEKHTGDFLGTGTTLGLIGLAATFWAFRLCF